MASLSWLLVAAVLACAFAEMKKANFEKCSEVSADACTVTEIRIDPCKTRVCTFKKRKNASISYDFVPNFAATKLATGLYWENDSTDVEFDQMKGLDGCTLTTCPTETGKSQTLNYSLHIGSKIPQGSFTFKWKLWNPDEPSQMCCFKTMVQIRK